MQIENTNSCIVSGCGTFAQKPPAAADGRKSTAKRRPVPPNIKINLHGGAAGRFFRDCRAVAKSGGKKIVCVAVGLAVTAAGITALGTYCTVGVNYYSGGKLLCTVAASDNAAAIIGSAARKAAGLGAQQPEIETSAKLALKSSVVGGDEAIDSILAASPGLCRGYIASVNGTDLFTAESKEAVGAALDEYIAKYKINDTASLSASIDIRSEIVREEEICDGSEITSLLEESGALTVMNTVDITEQQTITHETQQIADDTMYEGESIVETKGADGTLITINEQVYSNGQLLSAAVISSETKQAPVTEVVRVGTKPRNALEDGLSYPLSGGRLSSNFGERWGRMHRGIDLATPMDTPVAAAAAGTVITAEYKESYGNLVQIDHGYGIVTSYAHLDSIAVAEGQKVVRGEVVAYSGNTGNSTGPHLHFEVIDNGNYLNPLDHLI